MTDYRPVPCAFHEGLEFAVLRRQSLRLRYVTAAGEVEAIVMPLDVATRDGAEWLTFRDRQGTSHTLRLDRILGSEPV